MARAAEVLEPSVVLIENVPTVQHDVEKVVDVTIAALVAAGFAVTERIIDLAALGAPQRRRRHAILAIRGLASDADAVLDGLEVRCESHPARTVRWAIGDLVKVKSVELFDTPSVASPDNARRIQYLFKEDKYDLPNAQRPLCHHSDHSYRSMYGRLAWNQPAQTVTTGFGSMGQGRYVHPAQQRTITPHEACRLQMLPDFVDFSNVKTRGALAQLIGNTVPAVLGIAIGEKVMPALAKSRGWQK
jgi:DNA (cytosine-5)-methyltransferase 1